MTVGLQFASFGYHEVTDDPATAGFQRPGAMAYKHTTAAFERDLDAIAASGHAPEIITALDLTRPARHVLLTFDDGGKSAVHIGDTLAARGWRGHFFIATSLIGTRTFMDRSEIEYLRSCGHVIGSHSDTHPDIFRDLTPDRMLQEWRVSCDRLAQLLGEPCPTASLPGGDASTRVFRAAAQAGLHYLFTSEPWITPRRVDGCWILGRFFPKVWTPPERVGELARFRGWRRALLTRRLKGFARRAFPPLYRLYVRKTTTPWRTAD